MSLKFKTILFPADFSESSKQALDLAKAVAVDCGARIIALHVGSPPLMVTDGVMAAPAPVSDEYDRQGLEAQLQDFVRPAGPVTLEHRVVFGSPAEQILAHAEACHADLIVMGTHGRSGLGRLLMGSVAEHVLRKASCPVLLVKAGPARVSGQAASASKAKAVANA